MNIFWLYISFGKLLKEIIVYLGVVAFDWRKGCVPTYVKRMTFKTENKRPPKTEKVVINEHLHPSNTPEWELYTRCSEGNMASHYRNSPICYQFPDISWFIYSCCKRDTSAADASNSPTIFR